MIGARGCTSLYGLDGEVPLDRVWVLTSLSLTGQIISRQSVLNRVYNFVRVCFNYKQGIASTNDLIFLMKSDCTPSIQKQ